MQHFEFTAPYVRAQKTMDSWQRKGFFDLQLGWQLALALGIFLLLPLTLIVACSVAYIKVSDHLHQQTLELIEAVERRHRIETLAAYSAGSRPAASVPQHRSPVQDEPAAPALRALPPPPRPPLPPRDPPQVLSNFQQTIPSYNPASVESTCRSRGGIKQAPIITARSGPQISPSTVSVSFTCADNSYWMQTLPTE